MTFSQALATLNPEQLRAVSHQKGPMLVLACAGTGKTKVATLRIAELIRKGVPSQTILGLTFTNKAAKEMKERVEHLIGKAVLISTFHSLGARMLRESIHHLGYSSDFVIYDEDDSEKIFKECARDLGLPTTVDLKALRSEISRCKNNLVTPTSSDEVLFNMYERYHEKLKSCNAVDFDDLLFLPVQLLQGVPECLKMYQDRWQYICVDEYQDTNIAQYAFVKSLTGTVCNLFVVGDPDQSIYSWRGANIQNILNFEEDFPGASVVRLEQNYRSTSTILEAANQVIKNNQGRYEKKLWSALGEGDKILLFSGSSEREEAAFISKEIADAAKSGFARYNEVAIFYRTNFQSRVFEDELISRRVPYTIIGGVSFYQRREIKDVLSFLRLLDNPQDLIAFNRVINLPKRGIGETTLEKLIDAQAASGKTLLEFVLSLYQADGWNTIGFTLTAKQKEGLKDFAKIMLLLQETASNGTLEDLVRAAIFRTRYLEVLEQDPPTREERTENLEELIVKTIQWEADKQLAEVEEATEKRLLSSFLEELSLVGAADKLVDDQPTVSLMTIHNGKGLEFRMAFLAGLEEDLFPHVNCKKNSDQVEEERRLFYVGITRAKEKLYMSFAQKRSLWGATRFMRPSRFLQEVPQQLIKKVSISRMYETVASKPQNIAPTGPKTVFQEEEVVFHPQFGVGKVLAAYEGSMGLMYDIHFTKDQQIKKLVAAYAPLTYLK
jgi:DNA helicase II / ATP-dependent DNA helicase PcrA